MTVADPTTFHLVMSTVGRPVELERFLDHLGERDDVFITLVEQNVTDSCRSVLEPWTSTGRAEYIHEPLVRGLSRGRNRAMHQLRGTVVAFPDDDCWYGAGLLDDIARYLEEHDVDGLSTLQAGPDGHGTMLRWLDAPATVVPGNVFRTTTSASLFFRRELVDRIGGFDPDLGAGCGTRFGAGEESDFVLRALRHGAVIDFVPALVVTQPDWRDLADDPDRHDKVCRYNRGFGRVLRKHRMVRAFAYWTARSAAGVLISGARGDRDQIRHQWSQFTSRIEGFVARAGAR